MLAVRLGVGQLPPGIGNRHILAMAGVAGIGFTVSLFATDLAFDDPSLADQARLGVLVASILAAGFGSILFCALGPGGRDLER